MDLPLLNVKQAQLDHKGPRRPGFWRALLCIADVAHNTCVILDDSHGSSREAELLSNAGADPTYVLWSHLYEITITHQVDSVMDLVASDS